MTETDGKSIYPLCVAGKAVGMFTNPSTRQVYRPARHTWKKVAVKTGDDVRVDADGGSIRLYNDGRLMIQKLGKPETEPAYAHENHNFAGDCCYTTQRHFTDHLIDGGAFETNGPDYLGLAE